VAGMQHPRKPKATPADRTEQLRAAKRKQRERERAAGLMHVQLRLPRPVAGKLVVAARAPEFAGALEAFLDQVVIRLADYPALQDIAWNRAEDFIPAREAFGLYERNWRFVDRGRLDEREHALIRRLADQYGAGVIHA
jgi:hypothetical protein